MHRVVCTFAKVFLRCACQWGNPKVFLELWKVVCRVAEQFEFHDTRMTSETCAMRYCILVVSYTVHIVSGRFTYHTIRVSCQPCVHEVDTPKQHRTKIKQNIMEVGGNSKNMCKIYCRSKYDCVLIL